MEDMQSWIDVVTDPLGLAGFALFLVFGVLARIGRAKGQRWIAIAAVLMATVALIGGLSLSWLKIEATQNPTGTDTSQTTHGAQSPAVQNVQGDVTIKINPQDQND